jgi:hypothetical protein
MLVIELILIAILVLLFFFVRSEEAIRAKAQMPHGKLERFWDGGERRRHVRMRPLLDVKFEVERSTPERSARLKDISECGARLLIDMKLESGTSLNLEIAQPSPYRNIRIRGKVVWCNEARGAMVDGKRLFHIGVRFAKVSGDTVLDFHTLMESMEEALREKNISDGNTVEA